MRLVDFTPLARNLRDGFSSISDWGEVKISDEIKRDLSQILPSPTKFHDFTGIISTSGSKVTIFPYQYFLIGVLIKPLAILIKDYKILYERLASDCKTQGIDLAKVITLKAERKFDESVKNFDLLIGQEEYVIENVGLLIRLLTDENYRLKAKSIANHNGGQYKLRGVEDFFGSFFLQIINVPNASSSILGDIIFMLIENQELYDKLSNDLRKYLPFVIREKTLNNFIYFTLIVLRTENSLDSLLKYLKQNSDPKFYSLESKFGNLTSMFWCFDHLATTDELSQGNKIRCFEEPLFVNGPNYFYLSLEWANTGSTRLDYSTFNNLFNEIYSSIFEVRLNDTYFELIPMAPKVESSIVTNIARSILTSIKTKPFIILAGLSGTGKSRLVRTLAYQFNNIAFDRSAINNVPSNFQLVKVKPNWHDSSELIGYESRISGKDRFITTDFIRFLVKAWKHPETPFFLCLDEMNLAPVEQYFAEYLSVIETRRWNGDLIETDYLISPKLISRYADKANGVDPNYELWDDLELNDTALQQQFKLKGISLPPNLTVMGTVNMDETTHSFSRKVLDRAMTIEMNDINLAEGIRIVNDDWSYPSNPLPKNLVISDKIKVTEIFTMLGSFGEDIIVYLEEINAKLEGSAFKIAYRVRDEFLLYAYNYSLLPDKTANWMELVLDEMTLMKILPRIEGDEEKTSLLDDLIQTFKTRNLTQSLSKANEMANRRNIFHYTSFWI